MRTPKGILLKIVAVIIIFVVCVSGIYLAKVKRETVKFTPFQTGILNKDISIVKNDFVNVYFLKNDTGYVVIDAGNNASRVGKELKKIGVDPASVIAILLTHTHSDHIAAIKLFPNATLYMSDKEEKNIKGPLSGIFFNYKYKLLKDGEVRNIGGWNVKTIITPGHTDGSACYFFDDKYLFTGDSLSLVNGQVSTFNDFFNKNTAEQRKSLIKISSLDSMKLLLTAHYGGVVNTGNLFDRIK
jgi:glyoxylase-like metal-dependent hydrolase (beta-lactamase superfamily II)